MTAAKTEVAMLRGMSYLGHGRSGSTPIVHDNLLLQPLHKVDAMPRGQEGI
jgi:hypothetical protein